MISRFDAEIATASAAAALGVITMFGALEYGVGWSPSGPEPGAFPFYVGLIVALASAGVVGQSIIQRARLTVHFLSRSQLWRVIVFAVPIVIFVAASAWIGLYVAMALYLFAVMIYPGGYRVAAAAGVALATPVALYIVLEKSFQVSLMKGPIEAWMGL